MHPPTDTQTPSLTHTFSLPLSLPLSLSPTQIAGVNYGGHVTDDFDRRVLYTYIAEMFRDEILEQPYYKYGSLHTFSHTSHTYTHTHTHTNNNSSHLQGHTLYFLV